MDQVAVEHASEDMKEAFLQKRAEDLAALNDAQMRLNTAIDGQARALASAAAHRNEAALNSEKRLSLLEESGGALSQELKNLQKKNREHLLSAEEDEETAREIQPIIDRLTIEATDKAKVLVQWRDIFLSRTFKKMVHEEVTRLAQKLHAIILVEAKRRHTDSGYGLMSAIHNDDYGWVVADLVTEIRLALADENLEPEPLSDDVKEVLKLTDIGSFAPLSPAQRSKLAAELNNSAPAL